MLNCLAVDDKNSKLRDHSKLMSQGHFVLGGGGGQAIEKNCGTLMDISKGGSGQKFLFLGHLNVPGGTERSFTGSTY